MSKTSIEEYEKIMDTLSNKTRKLRKKIEVLLEKNVNITRTGMITIIQEELQEIIFEVVTATLNAGLNKKYIYNTFFDKKTGCVAGLIGTDDALLKTLKDVFKQAEQANNLKTKY